MYKFMNDYNMGCHPRILERLANENSRQFDGYGEDEVSEGARLLIKELLKNENCDIHFMPAGTHTNLTAIAWSLNIHQGVISAETGHIFTHESGAIEATGHKIIALPTEDGKLTADQVKAEIQAHYEDITAEHMVQPAMVYISNPTEFGTIYSKAELEALHEVCRNYDIPLYMDGARLAMALASEDNDVAFEDLCDLVDMFYIGGTKCGTLYGECLVIVDERYQKHFRYAMKQRGALMAKGFGIGLQFDELFRDGLYFELGAYSNGLAKKIQDAVKDKIDILHPQTTNQIFPILTNDKIKELEENYAFYVWQPVDDERSAIRICTFWGTDETMVDALIEDLLK